MSGTEQTFKDLPLTLCWKLDEVINNSGYQSLCRPQGVRGPPGETGPVGLKVRCDLK